MKSLYNLGRIFFAIVLAEMGGQMICCKSYPYMLLPGQYGLPWLAYILGIVFIAGGISLAFQLKTRQASLLLGILFLLIFVFYFIPYELLVSKNYRQIGDWENSAKELAFAGGAFAIAGYYTTKSGNNFLAKLASAGDLLYALPIVYFGILHFLFAKEASDYIPAWIPAHLFWMYFCGVALIGGGMSIILKIKPALFASLLGIMMFIWFAILHTPRVIVAAPADRAGEITSALLALAYSGIAFVIAGKAVQGKSKVI
jgi:uncharacterized membrane protein